MSRLEKTLAHDVRALRTLHDELALKTHLLHADMRDRWRSLEEGWDTLNEHLLRVEAAASTARPEIEAATALLAQSLKDGYADIRRALHK